MNSGGLPQPAVQGWVANRFYYQTSIPIKDAAVMANCRDRDTRRLWAQRIIDHDGIEGEDGGIEAWLQLGEAVGLSREELNDERHVLPGVRFAVDAYVNFAARGNLRRSGLFVANRTLCTENSSASVGQLAFDLSVDSRTRLYLLS